MTLIAAWITPEFRIITSDSRLNNEDGNPVNEEYQKIFTSNNLAIGLFGGFDIPFNLFRKEKLLKGVMKDENWDLKKFTTELNFYLENENIPNSGENKESNILIIPKNDESVIYRFFSDRKIQEFQLNDYKLKYQKDLPPDLFFSEQQLINDENDSDYQNELLKYFYLLKVKQKEKDFVIPGLNEPSEVKLMVKFLMDATDNRNPHINRKNIGGYKVFYAYCYLGKNWIQKEYPEKDKPLSIEEILRSFSEI